MSIETMMLPLFLLVIGGISLWNIIGAKGHWALKSFFMVLVASLCIIVWVSLRAIEGWPIEKMPYGKYQIAAIEVVEPQKNKGIKGGIFLLIKNMEETDKYDYFRQQEQKMSQRKPRLYGIPYSRKLHEQMNQMKKMMQGGKKPIYVDAKPKDEKKGKSDSSVEQEPDIQFHVLPPPKAPKSDAQKLLELRDPLNGLRVVP